MPREGFGHHQRGKRVDLEDASHLVVIERTQCLRARCTLTSADTGVADQYIDPFAVKLARERLHRPIVGDFELVVTDVALEALQRVGLAGAGMDLPTLGSILLGEVEAEA